MSDPWVRLSSSCWLSEAVSGKDHSFQNFLYRAWSILPSRVSKIEFCLSQNEGKGLNWVGVCKRSCLPQGLAGVMEQSHTALQSSGRLLLPVFAGPEMSCLNRGTSWANWASGLASSGLPCTYCCGQWHKKFIGEFVSPSLQWQASELYPHLCHCWVEWLRFITLSKILHVIP